MTVKWIEEVRQICGPTIPVLLVGCKKDLRDNYTGADLETKFVSTKQVRLIHVSAFESFADVLLVTLRLSKYQLR